MQENSTLIVERIGALMVLTLNRPEQLNALNRDLQRRLEEAFLQGDADSSIRCIILTGTGRAFCSGADVGHLHTENRKSLDEQKVKSPKFTARQCGIFTPTICAVNGVCAGAGLHFVADSDIVVASESASFIDTHLNVGQVTALEPIGLLRRTSLTQVLRMVLLGKAERISARAALEYNLVSEVVAPEDLRSRALDLGQIIAAVSPAAARVSLQAIYESMDLPLSQAYERGWELLMAHRAHPDSLEGVSAFLEKRAPLWK